MPRLALLIRWLGRAFAVTDASGLTRLQHVPDEHALDSTGRPVIAVAQAGEEPAEVGVEPAEGQDVDGRHANYPSRPTPRAR